MKVIFRVDSSVQIGIGHVMRCLTLAFKLREKGAEITFICRELPGNICTLIESKGFNVHRLPYEKNVLSQENNVQLKHQHWLGDSLEKDAILTKEVIFSLGTDINLLIVDHYALDITWELSLKPYVKAIMVIDDLADRLHECDVLLDQNLYLNMDSRYNKLAPHNCIRLLGPKYSLLRDEFIQQRKKQKKRDENIRKILVFFGGSDPSNETIEVINALVPLSENISVDVVVGASNQNKKAISKICRGTKNFNYHYQIDYMAQLMADADLFIGAGGSTTWERCCLGLPSIVVTIAENQIELTKAVEQYGATIYLGDVSFVTTNDYYLAIKELMTKKEKLKVLSEKSSLLVDGLGVERVVRDGIEKILYKYTI